MAAPATARNDEASLAVRAAWLHYVGGLKQSAVAEKLGVTSIKAHRLIMRANQDGAVKFIIDGEISECVSLENKISERYGLDYCEVVPNVNADDIPLGVLGVAGAKFLQREIFSGENDLIGLGHGRTLASCVSQLPKLDAQKTQFVSLLGGLNRNFSANPHDVMHRLAEKTGADAFVMPVPFFANSAEDREILLSQRGVADVLVMAARSQLKLVGIGTVDPSAQLVESGMIAPNEISEVIQAGAAGELLGHFFNQDGQHVETNLSSRTVSVELADIGNSRIVAVAGGNNKTRAIGSVLMSGLLKGLITDERTANELINLEFSKNTGRKINA
ncbi:MAG: sugar-binding transcriptional regulator [Hyphomicrobiales bacterium]